MVDNRRDIGRTSVDMGEVLRDISFPDADLDSLDVLLSDSLSAPQSHTQQKDLFAVQQRKSWDKSTEARCDFSYRLRLTRRSNINFISIWQKTVYGRTLTDIKGDPDMVQFFAVNICPVIKEMLGYNLKEGNWCIVTSPKRRHKVKNFATLISEKLGQMLEIPFYEDVAFCHTKQRVNAVFELNTLPKEPNIIVYDDFVTTGQTLAAMRNLLQPLGKNLFWVTNVNNKL